MQRDFSVALKSIGDIAIVDNGQPVTLKMVAINALLSNDEADRGQSGEEKYKRFKLADRIHASDTVEVSVEELALIKRLIGLIYPPVIVGSAYAALEST
ncbi:MAG: hypothetical protein RXR20_20535 [Paraburkholderia sp.]|jgi:hypothetical protein